MGRAHRDVDSVGRANPLNDITNCVYWIAICDHYKFDLCPG